MLLLFRAWEPTALKRAILRDNDFYAVTRFNAIRLGVHLAFLLDKTYFPYDKWLMSFFGKLPRMYERMGGLVDEAVSLSTVAVEPRLRRHLRRAGPDYGGGRHDPAPPPLPGIGHIRLPPVEHAYVAIIQQLPADLKSIVPVWD